MKNNNEDIPASLWWIILLGLIILVATVFPPTDVLSNTKEVTQAEAKVLNWDKSTGEWTDKEVVVKKPIQEDQVKNKIEPKTGIQGEINRIFGSEASIMTAIIKAESGMTPSRESKTDVTKDGYPFSIGLTQINLTVHTINGLNCPDAFNGRNFNSTVKDINLYNKCVQAAKNPTLNLLKAKYIKKHQGFNAWSVYMNGKYKQFMI